MSECQSMPKNVKVVRKVKVKPCNILQLECFKWEPLTPKDTCNVEN